MYSKELTAAQKRALFKAHFGKLLLKNGFVWCKDRYVRVHEGEIQLNVGLHVACRGFAFVCFGAVPFCLGTDDWEHCWGERIEQFIPLGPQRSAYLYSGFEDQMEQSYRLFRDSLFVPFNALRNVRSLLEYQQNHLLPALGYQDQISAAHICLQLEDWHGTRNHLLSLIAKLDEALEHHRKNEEKELQLSSSKAQKEHVRTSYAGLCEHTIREKNRLLQDVRLLDSGSFHPLRERIAQNISKSQAASRELFPRAWRS